MTLLIIDMDFLYQVNIGLIAPLFSFFSWKVWKKNAFKIFQKLAGLWLVGSITSHIWYISLGFWISAFCKITETIHENDYIKHL